MDIGKETIITKGCKLLLDAFQYIVFPLQTKYPTHLSFLDLKR
jgi:hypothetical protein